MLVSRSTQYRRAAALFAALTVVGAIFIGVFYSTHHTQRGLAAIIGTLLMLVIAAGCTVMASRYRRGRIY